MPVKAKAPVKKAAPKAKATPAKKAVAAKKAAAKLAKGDQLECYVCGLSIVVDEITGYAEERVLICCEEPMKAKRKKVAAKAAAKPAAKKPAAKTAAKKK